MVEVAIALPILFLLVFGVIEFGIAWFDKQTIAQDVKETARQGIVANYDDGFGCASGVPPTDLVCQAQARIGGSPEVFVNGPDGPPDPEDGLIGQELTICARESYDAITGFLNPFLDNRTLESTVTMRVEQNPPGGAFGDSANTANYSAATCNASS